MSLATATPDDIDPAAERIAALLTEQARSASKTASDFMDAGNEENASYWNERASFLLTAASQLSTVLAIAALGLSTKYGPS